MCRRGAKERHGAWRALFGGGWSGAPGMQVVDAALPLQRLMGAVIHADLYIGNLEVFCKGRVCNGAGQHLRPKQQTGQCRRAAPSGALQIEGCPDKNDRRHQESMEALCRVLDHAVSQCVEYFIRHCMLGLGDEWSSIQGPWRLLCSAR